MKREPMLWLLLIAAIYLFTANDGEKSPTESVQYPAGTVFVDSPEHIGEEAFCEQISRALRNKAPAICLKDYKLYNTADFYDIGYASYGAFWLENIAEIGEYVQIDENGHRRTMYLYRMEYYDLSDAQIENMTDRIVEEANDILDRIPRNADAWTAAKTIHDELCARITYDSDPASPHRHDMYGALVNHKAVCSAYTSAYAFLMYAAGYWGEGVYSNTHAWNCFMVPSSECFVDATWDDMDETDRFGRPYIKYDYFFLTADEVARVENHSQIGHGASFGEPGGNAPYNYYTHEGYMLYACDLIDAAKAFKRQLKSGSNILTVRFSDEADYRLALREWTGGEFKMSRIMEKIGFRDTYALTCNDDLCIISALLYYS